MSFVSLLMVIALLFLSKRRRAAVGRSELQIFLIVSCADAWPRTDRQGFGFMSALQAVTMSSMLEQASSALVILSAIHSATIAAVAWMLVYNGIVATQILE